jgi:hypothetical protein
VSLEGIISQLKHLKGTRYERCAMNGHVDIIAIALSGLACKCNLKLFLFEFAEQSNCNARCHHIYTVRSMKAETRQQGTAL